MEASAARLGALVRARRSSLRITQRQAAVAADLSNQTWLNIEHGRGNPVPDTLAGVDVAMRWEAGSAEKVLAGGEPTEVREKAPPDVNDALEAVGNLRRELEARIAELEEQVRQQGR